MKTFRFLDFEVYQKAKSFHLKIVEIGGRLKKQAEYYIADQILRSSLSVLLNIAEGSAKSSDKEFARFIHISLGSLNETVAGLDIVFTRGIITQEELAQCMSDAEVLAKQLGSFLKRLNKLSLG